MRNFMQRARRAFAEFLTIPTIVIAAFLALSALAYYLDQLRIQRGWPTLVVGSHESVSMLLGTIAGSIITVTSITFSLLLIAVQQSAAALTGQVYDQFLRRRANQAYFGFFVGLALYCLVILATVEPDYTPVYGATTAFVLVVVALYMIILLIYSSIDQMRSVSIVRNIRDHTLAARKAQAKLLAATRAHPSRSGGSTTKIAVRESGFLTGVDVAKLGQLSIDRSASEILILRSIGDYLSIGEEVVELRHSEAKARTDLDEDVLKCLTIEGKRDLATDPGFGIEQMANIAWTTISSSKQNPEPGKLVSRALRDLVAHWYGGEERVDRGSDECPVVLRDGVPTDLIKGFETLAVVASESMQHHTLAEVYRALALALRRVDGDLHKQVEDMLLRSLSMLGDHALTAELDESIGSVTSALPPGETRSAIQRSRDKLAESWGALNSRATRVKKSGA